MSEPGRVFGLHVTDQESTAVVVSAESGDPVRAPLVTPTVVYFLPGGTSTLRRPESLTAEIDVADRFVAHVGDTAGIVSARGVPMRAEDLLATTMLLLLTELSAPDDVTTVVAGAAYPAYWRPEQVDALREALDFLGLGNLLLYAETPWPGLDAATAAARAATGRSTPSPPATDRRLFYATVAAGVAAAILILGAGITYLVTDRTVTTAVPAMEDATVASTQPTTTRPVASTSIAFPTVSPGAPAPPPVVVPRTAAPPVPRPAPTAPAPAPAPIPEPVPVDPPVTEDPITSTPEVPPPTTATSSATTTISPSPTPAE